MTVEATQLSRRGLPPGKAKQAGMMVLSE